MSSRRPGGRTAGAERQPGRASSGAGAPGHWGSDDRNDPPRPAGGGWGAGWRIGLPAGLAIIPVGLAFGVLVTQTGLPWWVAPLLSGIVLGGSVEFLLVGMIAAAAPLAQIAVTTLLVNFRHVFYALSFPLHRVKGLPGKAYGTFALTDEAYALASPPEAQRWSRGRILGLQATFHLFWVASSTTGALLGSLIPSQVKGLDFALTALFVVLAIDAYKVRRSIPLPLIAVGAGLAGAVVFGSNMLAPTMGLYVVALLIGYGIDRARGRRLPTATGELPVVQAADGRGQAAERSGGTANADPDEHPAADGAATTRWPGPHSEESRHA